MDLKRFVRVVAHGETTRCGTGYLLDGERVLTARHVVQDCECEEVKIQYDDLAGSQGERAVTKIWRADDQLDAAVLTVATGLRLARQVFRPEPLTGDRPWRSRGWARASPPANDVSSVLDTLTALLGIAAEYPEKAKRLELSVEAPPSEAEWWKGVSGAPVFCGWQLLGVIVEAPDVFEGRRLFAVPVSALWAGLGFREAVGYDASVDELRERRRRQLVDDLTVLLEANSKAAAAIADERPEWQSLYQRRQDRVRTLADALCASQPWRDVVGAFDSAHEKLIRKDITDADGAADVIVDVLLRVLPEVYGSTVLEVMTSGDGGQLITLPVETETMAELAMAAVDGRDLAYEDVTAQQSYPSGRPRFSLPSKDLEHGFDPGSNQAWLDWLKLLAKWVGVQEDDVKGLESSLRLDDLARLVNHQLQREVARFHEPRRYFCFPQRFAERNRTFLEKVRIELDALHLVELAGDSMVDEREDCDPLQAILFRSYQTRNRKT